MIGLISDTHMPLRCQELPPVVFDVFAGADLIVHAGDVGELWVLDQLSTIAPVIAVQGNDESAQAKTALPFLQTFFAGGRRVVVTHGHYADNREEMIQRGFDDWQPKLSRWASFGKQHDAQVVIYGHTHIPMVKQYDGVWLVNPGAIASAGLGVRQTLRTIARLDFAGDGSPLVEHLNVDQPGHQEFPVVDWDAGFKVALNQVSESLLEPDLANRVQWLREEVYPLAPSAVVAALLPLAQECWNRQRDTIAVADVVHVVKAHQIEPVLAKFRESDVFNRYL